MLQQTPALLPQPSPGQNHRLHRHMPAVLLCTTECVQAWLPADPRCSAQPTARRPGCVWHLATTPWPKWRWAGWWAAVQRRHGTPGAGASRCLLCGRARSCRCGAGGLRGGACGCAWQVAGGARHCLLPARTTKRGQMPRAMVAMASRHGEPVRFPSSSRIQRRPGCTASQQQQLRSSSSPMCGAGRGRRARSGWRQAAQATAATGRDAAAGANGQLLIPLLQGSAV